MTVRYAPLVVFVALALPAAWAAAQSGAPAQAGAVTGPAAAARPDDTARRSAPGGSRLDERVALLASELELDTGQQAEVRKVLQVQRDRLQQAWNDPARSSADRIGVSQAISEQTADRIRALLREDQRKKYIAKPTRAANDRPEQGVDYWMDRMQGTR
jgi:hypothetical protein